VVADERVLTLALADSALDGREVHRLSVSAGGDAVLAVAIAAGEVREAWEHGRAVVARTGRWPVAIADWGQGGGVSNWIALLRDPPPREVLRAAASLSLADAYARFPLEHNGRLAGPWSADDWERIVEFAREETLAREGAAPHLADLLAIDFGRRTLDLERWLLDWEEARHPTVGAAPDWRPGWLELPPTQSVALAFLPSDRSEAAAAYLDFWAASEHPGGHEAVVRVLQHWRERCGAHVVANWGTVLQLVVERPPAAIQEAFNLAIEHQRVAADTSHRSLRSYARWILHAPTWSIHQRP
jgi:hypothetical protein